ncbi:MAG: hypothetical protein ABJA98_03055 [Acidobacteriota bacterium]
MFRPRRAAAAQVNLSGVWNNLGILQEDWPDRLFGTELGDYAGLPVNDAGRLRADTWNASLINCLLGIMTGWSVRNAPLRLRMPSL